MSGRRVVLTIVGMYKRHGPHLTLHESDTLEHAIGNASIGDLVRSPRIVVGSVDELIPRLSVTIQRTIAMTVPMDITTAEKPSTALILVADRQRMIEPVGDVRVP